MGIRETETVIKRILPYLVRRGYDIDRDLTFENPVAMPGTLQLGFIDILVHCGRANPVFVIEAKRDRTKISAKHRKQALDYGRGIGVLLVAVTNGQTFELFNTTTGKPLLLNKSALNRIPSRADLLGVVLPQLKKDKVCQNIEVSTDRSLPFRPGLPLSKLNHLIKQCHNLIRKIEKNEDYVFADFSKLMFLKLLEEKWDQEQSAPLYSYTFHELAALPSGKGDQVKTAIQFMIETIRTRTKYGSVLADPLHLKQNAAYRSLVQRLASVSFSDCDLDSKGAAFEYFVRATLKGKKLGQYFTPRPLVRLMLGLGRWEQILNSLATGDYFKVLDPACGTGGFLVLAMNQCVEEVEKRFKDKSIHKATADSLKERVREDVFYGIDAHEGVACSAKMNMIIAGDGYNNIRCEDSPNMAKLIPSYRTTKGTTCSDGKAHLILTNPPFGTSEAESLKEESAERYAIQSTRGQSLFIQLMIRSAHPGSLIVSVIDEGVLNTATYTDLRRHVLQTCRLEAVVELPDETFKPNKINVKSSVIVLRRRSDEDTDFADVYPVMFVSLASLGYDGSGEDVRGFDLQRLISEVCAIDPATLSDTEATKGYSWEAFTTRSDVIAADRTQRFDVRFWRPALRTRVEKLRRSPGTKTIEDLNTIETRRGKSPPVAEYVSEQEGYALVVKSGSNISKTGKLIVSGDYIDESIYQEYLEKEMILHDGDILLASTGDGTIGKCCVYRNKDNTRKTLPGVPEGHVTVIRVDKKQLYPEYLCDYLREGFGHDQLYRLFTGSTGMVEVAPEEVNQVLVPALPSLGEQKQVSGRLRASERRAGKIAERSAAVLKTGKQSFYEWTLAPPKK